MSQAKPAARPEQMNDGAQTLLRRAARNLPWLASPVLFALILVTWEILVRYWEVPIYILPTPTQIFGALMNGLNPENFWGEERYYIHIAITFSEAALGFVAGVIFGVGFGGLVAQAPVIETVLKPYVMGLQSLPKVAIAPLIIIWFGFGIESKVVLVALLVFFPLMINSIAGFKSVEPDLHELMRSLSASRWQVFRTIQVPTALPYIFAGLEMGVVYSFIGAVVGEFFGGTRGLGVQVLQMSSAMDVAGMFAVLILLAALGVISSKLVQILRRKVLYWAPSEQRRES